MADAKMMWGRGDGLRKVAGVICVLLRGVTELWGDTVTVSSIVLDKTMSRSRKMHDICFWMS